MAEVLAGAHVLSSVLLILETERTLVRLAREQRITGDSLRSARERFASDRERMELRDVDLDLCLDPTWPALSMPRSLDLIHLRTALWFHRQAPLGRFMTLDEAQRGFAIELGLPAR